MTAAPLVRRSLPVPALVLVFTAVQLASPPLRGAQPVAAQGVEALLAAGGRSLARGDFPAAVRYYGEADRVEGGRCAHCQLGLAKAHNGMGSHREALRSADSVLRRSDDPTLRRAAFNEQGIALLASANGDPAKLEHAARSFRQAIAIGGAPEAHFSLGLTLLRLGRDDEGTAALNQYLQLVPKAPNAQAAKDLIANPLRARKKLLPDLEMVTLDGVRVTTAGLRGKVVLLDFWGTWCAPCRAAVPDLRRLNARLQGSPFALVSISNDGDRTTLERFIAANEMAWTQVWDGEQTVIRDLAVRSFPTYVLVDHLGEVVFAASGWGPNVEREIETRVGSAVEEAKRSAGGS